MFTDATIAQMFKSMLSGIDVPPAPLSAIANRTAQVNAAPKRRSRLPLTVAAATAALLVLVTLPRLAPGLTQTVEQQVRALLRWTPPPPAPKSVWSAMRPLDETLATAQSHVSFTISPPAGLPRDVVSEKVSTIAAGVYTKATHSWSVGSRVVTFTYRRADGRSFMLTARRFDSREGPPSKYIFNADERDAHGLPVRHDVFTWRNGDQAMSAIAGEGVSAAEIAAIREAMHGVSIRGVWAPGSGGNVTQYRIPDP